METIPLLLKEFNQEIPLTQKMLALVPTDKLDWKPHPKSMSMNQLTTHLADIAGWPAIIFSTSVVDMAITTLIPALIADSAELLPLLQIAAEKGRAALEKATDEDLQPTWTLKYGDHIIMASSKYESIRHGYAQMIHHRAQLGVYLRLLNIAIPGTYGPSADDTGF